MNAVVENLDFGGRGGDWKWGELRNALKQGLVAEEVARANMRMESLESIKD